MIACIGTTPVYQRTMVFEHLSLDDVNRTTRVSDYASGKSINAARVVRALGEAVVAIGFAGGGRGHAMLRDLEAAKIQHHFQTVPVETRQCVTVIDRATQQATELIEESSPIDAADWRALDQAMRPMLASMKVCVFSGSLPPGAPQNFYARWIGHAGDARIIVDARGEPLKLCMQHPGFVIKLNADELAATLGLSIDGDEALQRAMQQALPAGPAGAVVVTLGKAGSMALDATGCWRLTSPRVTTVSAVGSGDAFAAGLAVGLARNLPLVEACMLGASCGAANAASSRAGDVDPMLAKQLREQVTVTHR